jgi:xanthosine utilization system XapX-like protein
VSEQDFFFDEEPEVKAPAAKAPAKPAAKAPARSSSAPTPAPYAPRVDQSSSYAVAALVGVIGLLLGAILGFLLGTVLAGNAASSASSSAAPAPVTSGQGAPTLTQEQLNTTALPPGHPAVSSTGAAETTPAP